jgi:hypothetical protein
MQVYKHDISTILERLPELEKFLLQDHVDVFITTLGFEDRTHRIIDLIADSEFIKNCHLLLIKYPTNEKDNDENLSFFKTAAKKMASYKEIVFSRINYAQQLSNILDIILDRDNMNVFFDISTCSSYVFYPTMAKLVQRNINLSVVYSEAEIYYPTQAEWRDVAENAKQEQSLFIESFENASFQSAGIDDVYPYSPFEEFNPGNRPSFLVAVPNFSCSRMNAIVARDREINKTSSNNIMWLIGDPPSEENKWRSDAIRITNNLSLSGNTNIQAVSTLEYKDMLLNLENIWSEIKYKNHMTIATLGSKNQHLGTFFFLALHKNIGLWLVEPKEFKANRFSSGYGMVWQIKFGHISELIQLLNKYMSFEYILD